MPRKADRIFIATQNFTTTLSDGTSVVVTADITRVREGHELLQGREMMFREMDVHYEVEAATAEPGEKRGAPATTRG